MTQLIVIPKNIEESKSLVGQIRETLEQSGVSSYTEVRPFDIRSSNELFETYFQPVERFLPNVTRIYLVPPDELGPIPFEIFSRSTTKDAINSFIDFNKYTDIEWLNDSYEFIYVPSANSFVSNFKRPGVRNHRYLGIGDPTAHSASEQASTSEVYSDLVLQGYTARSPVDSLPRLPNARRQLEVLGQAFDKNPRIVSGSRATEATVRKELNDPYSIIAFATHALLGDSQDEPPYLVLSSSDEAGPQDDGLLTTFEIAELDVRANLIVLSACNTATPGNTRAFTTLKSRYMHAGASTVVASHWSVEERATTELLSEMARQLGDGETASISSALKAARSSVLRDSRNYAYSHPLFWGGFTVRGVANDTFLSPE